MEKSVVIDIEVYGSESDGKKVMYLLCNSVDRVFKELYEKKIDKLRHNFNTVELSEDYFAYSIYWIEFPEDRFDINYVRNISLRYPEIVISLTLERIDSINFIHFKNGILSEELWV